jgi:hypothetical protein
MQVTFTKADGKRYLIGIDRELGPPLLERYAPGYDDLMPHDLAHFVVEEHFGIELGVWGQLAAGGGGIFYPAAEDDSLQNRRRIERIGRTGRADMARSEDLVVLCVSAWERSIGRVKHQSRDVDVELTRVDLRRAVARIDETAQHWQCLAYGGSLVRTWPSHLTFHPSRSQRGRSRERNRRGR